MTSKPDRPVTRRHLVGSAIVAAIGWSPTAHASEAPCLTITGRGGQSGIPQSCVAGRHQIGIPDTTTDRHDDNASGPLLADARPTVSLQGQTLVVPVLTDEAARVPFDSSQPDMPIRFTRYIGEVMPGRVKGPLLGVDVVATRADLRDHMVDSRSLWQVNRIDVL